MFDRIVQRIIRIIQMDWTVFSDIQFDEEATREAAVVVGIAALASALGALGGGFVGFLVHLLLVMAIYWLLWSYITMFVGTKLFEGEASFEQMARTLGYSNAPLVLGLFGLAPCLGGLIRLAAGALALVLTFFAVRETQRLSTEKAIATVVIGWMIAIIASMILSSIIGV